MLRKILKWSFISLMLLITTIVVLYFVNPKLLYSGVKATAGLVLQTKPYPTKNRVHPLLQKKVNAMIKEARKKGIDLRVVSSFRDMDKQAALYAKGRNGSGKKVTNAPPGFSYHNYGLAVDVVEYKNGKPNWKSKNWNTIGKLGKEQGLVWGGDWKRLVDKPHFQLSLKDVLLHVIF